MLLDNRNGKGLKWRAYRGKLPGGAIIGGNFTYYDKKEMKTINTYVCKSQTKTNVDWMDDEDGETIGTVRKTKSVR